VLGALSPAVKGTMNRSGPPNTYGITGPTKAGHQYNKIWRLSSEFPVVGIGYVERKRPFKTVQSRSIFAANYELISEATHGLRLLIVYVENVVKLGDLKEIRYFFG
jgi:hypothetical protein